MSRTVSPSAGRRYGLARVVRVWGVARATVYRRRRTAPAVPRRRPGPIGPMPDAGLPEAIRQLLTDSPFRGEGHRKVATARSGRGCASPACGPPGAGCCG